MLYRPDMLNHPDMLNYSGLILGLFCPHRIQFQISNFKFFGQKIFGEASPLRRSENPR